MKYCPYCGASLAGSAASFCAECGERMPAPAAHQDESPQTEELFPAPAAVRREEAPPPPEEPVDTYDGYYDDVLPSDSGHTREGLQPELIKRIALLGGGVLVVIVLAVLAMYYL